MLPQSHSTAIQSFRDFFPPHVVTFVSDRSADFSLRGDHIPFTAEQKDFLTRQLGYTLPEIFTIRQVHGRRVVTVCACSRRGIPWEEADGILTDQYDFPLTVRTADCLPVFIYDPCHETIGLIHAGWRGTRERILDEALGLMRRRWNSRPGDLRVAFGPAIRLCCYEVSASFSEYFPRETIKREQKYFLDLPQVNKNHLVEAGVDAVNILDCGVCTHCDPGCFSYRREGEAAGRMLSLMMLKKQS